MAEVDEVIALMVTNKEPKEKIIEFINNYKKQKAASKAETETEVKEDDFVSSIPGLKEKLVKTQETKTPEVSVSSPKKTTATKVEEPGFYDSTQTEVEPKNVLDVSDDILGDILKNTTEKDEVVKPPAPHITNEQLVDYIRPGMDIMENYRNMNKEYGMVKRLEENYEGEGLAFEVRDEFGINDSIIATNARGETFRIDTDSKFYKQDPEKYLKKFHDWVDAGREAPELEPVTRGEVSNMLSEIEKGANIKDPTDSEKKRDLYNIIANEAGPTNKRVKAEEELKKIQDKQFDQTYSYYENIAKDDQLNEEAKEAISNEWGTKENLAELDKGNTHRVQVKNKDGSEQWVYFKQFDGNFLTDENVKERTSALGPDQTVIGTQENIPGKKAVYDAAIASLTAYKGRGYGGGSLDVKNDFWWLPEGEEYKLLDGLSYEQIQNLSEINLNENPLSPGMAGWSAEQKKAQVDMIRRKITGLNTSEATHAVQAEEDAFTLLQRDEGEIIKNVQKQLVVDRENWETDTVGGLIKLEQLNEELENMPQPTTDEELRVYQSKVDEYNKIRERGLKLQADANEYNTALADYNDKVKTIGDRYSVAQEKKSEALLNYGYEIADGILKDKGDGNFKDIEEYDRWTKDHQITGWGFDDIDTYKVFAQGLAQTALKWYTGGELFVLNVLSEGLGMINSDVQKRQNNDQIYDSVEQLNDLYNKYTNYDLIGKATKDDYEGGEGPKGMPKFAETLADGLPFMLAIMATRGKNTLTNNLGGKILNPKNLNDLSMATTAFKIVAMDNVIEGQNMGLSKEQALAYGGAIGIVTGMVQTIMPDAELVKGGVINKILKDGLGSTLKNFTTKEGLKFATGRWTESVLREIAEEEIEMVLGDAVKLGFGLGHTLESTELKNHLELIQATVYLSGTVGTIGAKADYDNVRKNVHRQLKGDISGHMKTLDNAISGVSKKLQEARESGNQIAIDTYGQELDRLNKAVEYARNFKTAINIAPENVTDEDLTLLTEKVRLEELKKNQDPAFNGAINLQIKNITDKIAESNVQRTAVENNEKLLRQTTNAIKKLAGKAGTSVQDFEGDVEGKTIQERIDEYIDSKDENGEYVFDEGTRDQVKNNEFYGTYVNDKKGNKILLINREASASGEGVNVAAHEFLHHMLETTFAEIDEETGEMVRDEDGNVVVDKKKALGIGSELMKWVMKNQGQDFMDSEMVRRLETAYGDAPANVQMQEVLTTLSDAMVSGDLTFDETAFDGLKGFFRRTFQKMGMNVKFNTGEDIFNFIKDYNKTIASGKELNRAQQKVLKQGAKVGGDVAKAISGEEVAEIQGKEDDWTSTLDDIYDEPNRAKREKLLVEYGKTYPSLMPNTPFGKHLLMSKPSNVKGLLDKYGGDKRTMVNEAISKKPNGKELNWDSDSKFFQSEFGQEIAPITETIAKRLFDPIPVDQRKGITRAQYIDELTVVASVLVQNEFDASQQDIDKFISNRLNLRANKLAKDTFGIQSTVEYGGLGATIDIDAKTKDGAPVLQLTEDDVDFDSAATSELDKKDVKLRELKNFDIYLDSSLGNELAIAEVNAILGMLENGDISIEKARSLMKEVTLKDVRAALSESIPKIAKDKTSGTTKPTPEYESWIRSEYDEIVQSLDIKTIRKYKFFEASVTGKKDYKNINPLTGKVSNFVKPTQVNTTNKREYLRYFLEGKPNDLIERRTALIRRIAERKTSLAVDNYIKENSNNMEAVLVATMNTLSSTPTVTKGEQTSFDTVKFSKFALAAKNKKGVMSLVTDIISNYKKGNIAFDEITARLAGYDEETVNYFIDSGIFDLFNPDIQQGFVIPTINSDWPKIFKKYKKIYTENSTDSKEMKDAQAESMSQLIKDLPPQVVRFLGKEFFGMTSARALDAAVNKNDGTKAPYLWLLTEFNDKAVEKDWNVDPRTGKAIKLPFDPKKLELLNSKSGLMVQIQNIQNLAITKEEKIERLKALQPRIDAANSNNKEFIKWMSGELALAMVKNPKLVLGIAANLQGATNNVKSFRAYTDLGMIKLQDGSQAPYLTKNGSPTNIKPTSANGGGVNRDNPDFDRALEYVADYAKELQLEIRDFWTDSRKGKKGEALIKLQNKYDTLLKSYDSLTSESGREIAAAELLEYKGEHIDPSANIMQKLFASVMRLSEMLSNEPNKKYHAQIIREHQAEFDDILANFDQSLGPKLDSKIQDEILGSTSQLGYLRNLTIQKQLDNYIDAKTSDDIKPVIDEKITRMLQIVTREQRIKNDKIDRAKLFSRKANPAKGISVLDFDDTLAVTKSGVRYTLPNPSGKPQPKKKVIFMAGGPGSGKSNVINQLGLKGQGFKVVNQDISLEWLMKNHGMPTDMREFTPEQASEFGKLSAEARGIALKKRIKYQGEGDGVIIDGTGASLNVMKKNIQDFQDKGYDVQMIFVETSQETALSRNKARKERSLRTGIVIKTHDSVQANKEAYKELFGKRFAEVNTDNLKQGDVMPADIVNKVNDFTSGYIKGRLNAGEYATKGEELKQQGAEFDFSEFNQVVEGETAPLFNKAMKLQEKFTSKDMFVLTARPAESNQAIFEFLQANGLNIPIENIVGLGSSLSSDKALWMAGKVGEGYNDFYFADDILENVQAVSDMLEQFDVKSKVQQAKRDFVLGDPKVTKLLNEKSMNDVKDVDGLANPGVYSNVKFSKSHRAEYENTVAKNRPDLSGKEVTATIDKMFEYIDGLDVPNKRKYEQITTKWLATSNIKLPEDSYKIQQAVEIAELKKEDIFSYKNPNEIIEKYAGTIKVKPISPVGIKEFTRATGFNDPIAEYGIVEYEVEETREAQQKVRDIVNTHWGPNSNPWCITKIDKDGNLSEDAWRDWTSYGKGPKRIVFQNGKLLAMKANYEYWGKMNKHSEGPIIQVKEGNVTNTTELVVGDGGIVDPIIRETRTVSKDGNTVTTNIFENSQDGYAEGTTIVENRIKGVKIKETRFDPDGSKVNTQEFNKKGKPTTSYQFNPNGKVKSINGHLQQQAITEAGLDVNAREDADIDLTNELVVRVGDIIENNYTETETDGTTTDYFYGRALVGDQVMEIGFESKTGLDLADVTKTIDGKTRLDIGKVIREVDPNVKGLPKTGIMFSKGASREFNDIIEQSTGVGSEKVFSDAQAKIRGNKTRFDNIVPYSVQDLMGLLYNFVGKGKVGERHMEFFKKALIDPFARAINELNQSKQSSAGDYSNLTKAFPNVKKKLNKEVESGDYTYDQAIRVYLWNKAGFEVPGLSKRDLNALDSIVKNDPELQAFADTLGLISKKEEGYAKPGEYWLVENIASDLLSDGSIGDARSEFLAEWQQNADEIFSKENLNKIQAIYGNKFREALEDILYRMKNGTNRPTGSSRLTNNFMNWINNSTGAIMFFNMRSALLQTLSTTNYINWTDNNPLKAAAAFANQKQYWSDFSALFNSDFLKQRRSGNQRSINEAELTTAVANSDNKAKAALAWLLQKGFLPTQIMDSFAISAGGATFYRNRINKYIKEGMSPEQAREKAFLDFQEITEATQQSARPDMISQQQASPLGRLILSFQNTPMQYARIMNKAARDIVNGRGDQKSNISKIAYYGAIQSIIFASLQTAIFAALGDDEEEEFDKKKQRIVGSMVDGWLAGLGVAGKAIGTIERSIKEYLKQKERGFNSDHAQTIIQLLGFSPPIGSKLRKIYSAIQTEEFNKGVSEKRGFTLDNPTWSSWGNVIEGFTNIPLGRISNKLLNIDNALDSQNQWWERAALLLGWNTWDLGIKDPDITAVKGEIKEERKVEKKKEAVIKKEEKKQEIKEENISKEEANIELQKKEIEDGNESPDCAAINKRGERCGTKIEKGSTYCTIHTKVEQNDGGKKTQCGKTKKDGKRCKMQTSNKSGYCYYHD
jgi:predicted kinase